jgi:hypothetical protein
MSKGSSNYESVDVITTIRQTIEVPKSADRQEILNFLAQEQSFNDAFKGLRNDEYDMFIEGIEVIDEDFD